MTRSARGLLKISATLIGRSRYDDLRNQLRETEDVRTPALMIQALSDNCDPPNESEGPEEFFTGGYRRVLLDNVGHFPHREAPGLFANAVLDHFLHT
jgi:pimeloyl-ACP methyl ester carboxylesterase